MLKEVLWLKCLKKSVFETSCPKIFLNTEERSLIDVVNAEIDFFDAADDRRIVETVVERVVGPEFRVEAGDGLVRADVLFESAVEVLSEVTFDDLLVNSREEDGEGLMTA